MAHEGFHEDPKLLSDFTKDYHRIIISTIEELEAIDWYNQRAEAATNAEAKAILEHNRDEEIEHACMGLEWLRRNSPKWDAMMREFLFKEGSIIEQEAVTTGKASGGGAEAIGKTPNAPKGVLNIGNNK